MNSVWEPELFYDVDCDSNQTEVVLLIFFSAFKYEKHDKLKKSLLPYIRKNNYKIMILKSNIGEFPTFLFIKKQLDAKQRIKIVIFGHFFFIADCNRLSRLLNLLENFQLPCGPDNLGLVLLENGEHKEWDKGLNKLDLALLPSHLENIYVTHGMAWDRCVDLSYSVQKCEQYGCPVLKILTQKDLNDQFTNILLMKMTLDGQLLEGKEKLEAFINDRLQFTNLTKRDVQLFQPDTFQKLNNYFDRQKKVELQRIDDYMKTFDSILIHNLNSTSSYSTLNSRTDPFRFVLENHANAKKRSKRHNSQELAGVDDEMFGKMFSSVNKIYTRSDVFSVKILNAMLKLLNKMDSEYDSERKQTICNRKTATPDYSSTDNEWARDDIILGNFMDLQKRLFNVANLKTMLDKAEFDLKQKTITHAIKLVRVDCEKIFQSLIAEFTNNWYNKTERIETAVDRLTKKLTQWADKAPIYGNDTITWENFSNWTGTHAIQLAGINIEETSYVFKFIKQVANFNILPRKLMTLMADFHWMIRNLLYTFNRNVTTVAIQQLATSKLERVDAVVAVLDRTFMIGIRNLHQNIDREEWMTIRPPIFNYLHRFQQKTLLFDQFLMSMKAMFDIHDIDMPITPYERLQVVKAEFDVYQKQMGGYLNGTNINTTQQWGRVLHQTTEYMFKNSGVQHKSFINGAAKWIKDELMFERNPIWPGFEFDGTLVLLNLIVRKWFKGRRNF
jgi:hypothetical protein